MVVVVAVVLFLLVVTSLLLVYCIKSLRRKKHISFPVLKSEVEESQRRSDYYLLGKDDVSADGSYEEPVDAILGNAAAPEVSALAVAPGQPLQLYRSRWP